jgi:predicted nucleotidyltransferase/DNA-binding transcriptional ArsR family regulator
MAKVNAMLKVLFSSATRIRVLAYLFLQPGRRFYLRQLEKILNISVGQLGREISRLEKIGLLSSVQEGKQKYYALELSFPFHDELRSIFLKTSGAGDVIRQWLSKLKGIELVFIYGSFGKGDERGSSDIDVMAVGDIPYRDLSKAISQVEKVLKREVHCSLYERKEIKARLRRKDRFLTTVFTDPKIIILGKSDDELLRVS